MPSFEYIDHVGEVAGDCLVGRVPHGIRSKQELLLCLYEQLKFPSDFGFNWDALVDCLREFGAAESVVILVHEEVPPLPAEELAIYLSILKDAVTDRRLDPSHVFRVVFPTNARDVVEELCADGGSR